MSHSRTPARPTLSTISAQTHHPQRTQHTQTPDSAPSPTNAIAPALTETVDIPLDGGDTQPQSLHKYYYQHHESNSRQRQHQHTENSPPPSHDHQQRFHSHQKTQRSIDHNTIQQRSSPIQSHHHQVTTTSLLQSNAAFTSPRHIRPTFLPLHHQNAHSASPVLHALSSTLSSALSHVTAGINSAKATSASQAITQARTYPRVAGSPSSAAAQYPYGQEVADDAASAEMTGVGRTSTYPDSSHGAGIRALPADGHWSQRQTTQTPQPAAISWTLWTVRPAGRVRAHNHKPGVNKGDEWRPVDRVPALFIGYTSGALQIYVFDSPATASGVAPSPSLSLDEVIFLPRVPVATSSPGPPPSLHHAGVRVNDDKVKRPASTRTRSATSHASAVHGALFLSTRQVLVLAERPLATVENTGASRVVELTILSLEPTLSGEDSAAHEDGTAISVPSALTSFKIRDLDPSQMLIAAELKASGTSFVAVALSIASLNDSFANSAPTSEIHALKITSSPTSPRLFHACAPITDLPPGIRPTLDLTGRVLAYAARIPTINARDRAAGGNFIAATGAFGSQSTVGARRIASGGDIGPIGLGSEGFDPGYPDGVSTSYLGMGLSSAGGVAAGGAAAAVVNLGQRAAAAGFSSVSALTAAAAARFSPSSIGSATGMSATEVGTSGGLHGTSANASAPGWEQHATAAASAISIGAGAGVDVAKRVGSGVLSGVRGLSGYFGSAQGHASSPPYAASQLSRSAPHSQGLVSVGHAGPPGRVIAGFTPATSNAVPSEHNSSPYSTVTAQQRRFSSGIYQQQQQRHSISQRSGSRLGGMPPKLPSTAVPDTTEATFQNSTDSPVLQASSHEDLGLGRGVATSTHDTISTSAHTGAGDATSTAGTSVGSKRLSGQSLTSAPQAHGQSIPYAPGTSSGSGKHISPFSHSNAAPRHLLNPGPVWVRVVDLASSKDASVGQSPDSLAKPRTLALFRPPNSSPSLLHQVGLGWTAGTNAMSSASTAAAGPGGGPGSAIGGAALLSSSMPRSPPSAGGIEYVAGFSGASPVPGAPGSSPGSTPPTSSSAFTLGPNPVALLSLSPDGSSLLTADALGQVFHIWEMMPCPAPVLAGASRPLRSTAEATAEGKARTGRVSSQGSHVGGIPSLRSEEESLPPSVWHRYKLHRGHTSALTVAASWSSDAQFVFVQSQKGTVHAYPVNPHGGAPSVAKHLQQRHGTNGAEANALSFNALSVEVKALARLRPVDIPSAQSLVTSSIANADVNVPPQVHSLDAHKAARAVPTLATPSLFLLGMHLYPEGAGLVADEADTRRLQLLVYHPARDLVLLHSLICASSVDKGDSGSTASSLISGLPRSISAPVAAVASSAAAASSSGLSRVMSRTGSSWGVSPVPGETRRAEAPAAAAHLRADASILSTGAGGNSGHPQGLSGDSVALAAWNGLARKHFVDVVSVTDDSADNANCSEIDFDEDLALGDDAEALSKRATYRAMHLRHGSSPLARPALDVTASRISSPSASDEDGGVPAKSNGTVPANAAQGSSHKVGPIRASDFASVEVASNLSGEGKKTTATSSPLAGGKKKRKGTAKTSGDVGEATIPVLELPPPSTKGVAGDLAIAPSSSRAPKDEYCRPTMPAFKCPSWVTQIEVETYDRTPRSLPSSIWLSHQFDFREPEGTSGTASAQLHALYRLSTSRLSVRDEVRFDAPSGEDDLSFDKGLLSAIGARSFEHRAFYNSRPSEDKAPSASYSIPMFPQGQRARHPAWHERVIAVGGVPIRNVAGGLGHGLGRAGRGLGRTVEEAMIARRKRLSTSSAANDEAGFEAFDFVDDEGGHGADDSDNAGVASFMDVRAAKEAAGLSVEDLPVAEIDSDDEQTWKDAKTANQGLDDEFEGWDGFATEGIAPPEASRGFKPPSGSTDDFVAALLREDGGIGAPSASSLAAPVPGASGAGLARTTQKLPPLPNSTGTTVSTTPRGSRQPSPPAAQPSKSSRRAIPLTAPTFGPAGVEPSASSAAPSRRKVKESH